MKITLPELVSLLAEESGESKRRSEEFLKLLFTVIGDALEQGESVKVPGLGTFKLIEIDARKSVNVQTGEEYEIASHKRVSFVPAKEMANEINLPFAAFESVELADSLSESELERVDSEALSQRDIAAMIAEPDEPAPAEEEPAVAGESAVAKKPVAEEAENGSAVAEPVDEPVAEAAADVVDTPEAAEAADVSDEEELPAEKEETSAEDEEVLEEEEEEVPVTAPVETVEEESEDLLPRCKPGFWAGIAIGLTGALLVLGIVLVCLFWWYPESLKWALEKNSAEPAQITVPVPVPEADSAVAVDSTAVAPESERDSRSNDLDEVATLASDQPEEPTPVYDVIGARNYLTTMAQRHYGSYHLWPYIYDANPGLGHPDRIKPGTRIRIPSVAELGINPADPAVISKAKSRGAAIYSSYQSR